MQEFRDLSPTIEITLIKSSVTESFGIFGPHGYYLTIYKFIKSTTWNLHKNILDSLPVRVVDVEPLKLIKSTILMCQLELNSQSMQRDCCRYCDCGSGRLISFFIPNLIEVVIDKLFNQLNHFRQGNEWPAKVLNNVLHGFIMNLMSGQTTRTEIQQALIDLNTLQNGESHYGQTALTALKVLDLHLQLKQHQKQTQHL